MGPSNCLALLKSTASHGSRSLEIAGVMPFDLSMDSIELCHGRAFLAALGRSCLIHDGDSGFGCEHFWDREDFFLGSALNHAPEMFGGRITGPSNSVWATGLIFAELMLGQKPATWFFTRSPQGTKFCDEVATERNCASGKTVVKLDRDPEGREKIREAIYNDFRIEDMEGFRQAPEWAQEILDGMLAKKPQDRWTASDALTRAHHAAVKLGVDVPRKVRLEDLPVDEYADAFT